MAHTHHDLAFSISVTKSVWRIWVLSDVCVLFVFSVLFITLKMIAQQFVQYLDYIELCILELLNIELQCFDIF